jgi:hypothetical protein
MAHYQYNGQHFELPDGLDNDAALNKIKVHLGESPKKVEDMKAPKWLTTLGGVPEAALNLAGGVGGMFVAPVGAALNKVATGGKSSFEQDYFDLMGKAGSTGTTLADATGLRTEGGDTLNHYIGKAIEEVGIPMAGVVGALPRSANGYLREITGNPKSIGKPTATSDVPRAGDVLDTLKAKPLSEPQQLELPLETSAQSIAEMRARAVGQGDLFGSNNPTGRNYTPEWKANEAVVQESVQTGVDAARRDAAQKTLEARQAAMEQEVARQTSLDMNAAERARQEKAGTGYADWQANKAVEESTQTHDFLSRAKQSDIYDIDNGDPLTMGDRPPQFGMTDVAGRVDENGIPIRADLSMEAQNLQNPLQRNLWGDELPGRNPQDNSIGMTQALDKLPPGPARQAAIEALSGQKDISLPGKINDILRGPGRGQQGALNFEDISKALASLRERFGAPEDTIRTPTSPEKIAEKQAALQKAKVVSSTVGIKLPEWYGPQTFEEAAILSRDAKDMVSNPYTRGIAPGNNFMAAYHNNPLLKYARKLFADSRAEVSEFSKKYVTAPETGLSALISKMSALERVQVAELLTELDKRQIDWSTEAAEALKVSDNVNRYLHAHREALNAQWEWHLKNTGEQGLNIARKRSGYSPGVFEGSYNSLVLKDGKPVGILAVDSPGEFMKAKAYYEQKYPGAKFSANTWQEARRGFSGSIQSAFKYRDLGAMLEMLSKADGEFSKIQMQVSQEAIRASTDLFNFNQHNLAKKGIEGNQGNKGWLSPEQNAKQRLESVVRFLEQAAEHHSLQKTSEELRLLMADESTAHLSKTKQYLDDYFKNVSGNYINTAGKVINGAFDGIHSLVEEAAAKVPGLRRYIGPNNTLKLSNVVKNKMAQMYMGWFNWTFTVSQFMQPVQTGVPMLELVGNRLGMNPLEAQQSFVKGGSSFVQAQLHRMGILKDISPEIQDAVNWAEKRGLLDFTELERAYEGNKTKVGRMADKTAEWSMQIGEGGTRPPMFLAFVDILSKQESNKTVVYEMAEHLTNQTMADYHKWERPLVYNGLGVLSPHAGGLTTFKHNFMGTQVLLAKEARKPGIHSKAPLALSVMSMLMFGGITATPFYNEFNTIYENLRESLLGEKRSIAQDALKELPQWSKTGIASSMIDLNAQGKFSSADMIPDTFSKAAFPHLSGAYDIASDAVKSVANPSSTNLSNLAVSATPSGFRQAMKGIVKRDGDNLLNKAGQVETSRTPEEWNKSAATGLVPLKESVEATSRYQNLKNEKARTDKVKQLSLDFKAAVIANQIDKQADILNEYEKLGGDARQLAKQIPKILIEADKTTQDRLEGIPKSRQGVRRYEAFQN